MATKKVEFKYGTKNKFDAIAVKDDNTLYFLTDKGFFYKGDKLFGVGVEATEEVMGLLSAADKAKLNALADTYFGKEAGETLAGVVDGILDGTTIDSFADVENAIGNNADTVKGDVIGTESDTEDDDTIIGAKKYADTKVGSVTAGNDGVVIGGTDTAPTIGVKLSPKEGNQLTINNTQGEEGLYYNPATADEYSFVKDNNSGDYAAVYHLTKNGSNVGVSINIPKDMVVESGSVVTNPVGQPAGTYLKLVLANATNDEIFINASDFIEYVTSGSEVGDMVVVTIDANHRVTATITAGSITATELSADLNTEIGKAHTHDNKSELDLFETGDKSKLDTAATKAAANETAIDALKTLIGTLPDNATATTVIGYISEVVGGELSWGEF